MGAFRISKSGVAEFFTMGGGCSVGAASPIVAAPAPMPQPVAPQEPAPAPAVPQALPSDSFLSGVASLRPFSSYVFGRSHLIETKLGGPVSLLTGDSSQNSEIQKSFEDLKELNRLLSSVTGQNARGELTFNFYNLVNDANNSFAESFHGESFEFSNLLPKNSKLNGQVSEWRSVFTMLLKAMKKSDTKACQIQFESKGNSGAGKMSASGFSEPLRPWSDHSMQSDRELAFAVTAFLGLIRSADPDASLEVTPSSFDFTFSLPLVFSEEVPVAYETPTDPLPSLRDDGSIAEDGEKEEKTMALDLDEEQSEAPADFMSSGTNADDDEEVTDEIQIAETQSLASDDDDVEEEKTMAVTLEDIEDTSAIVDASASVEQELAQSRRLVERKQELFGEMPSLEFADKRKKKIDDFKVDVRRPKAGKDLG